MFGTGELILILCVALILFGGKRLPELARSLGIGIREFKRALHDDDSDVMTKPKNRGEKGEEPIPVTIEVEADHPRKR